MIKDMIGTLLVDLVMTINVTHSSGLSSGPMY